MNQQQLDAIKARALAAFPDGTTGLEKVKAVATERCHVAAEVFALVAEVERLRAIAKGLVAEFHKEGYSLKFVDSIYELQEVLGDEEYS
jgi:hypothetical protein